MVDPLTTAAISWSFTAAGWLISPVLSRFLNKCFDALDIDPKFKSKKQILLVKLAKLETTLLPQLLILTDAAQQSPHRLILEKWLQKLKSAFYEAEYVLDLVEWRHLEKEVNNHFPSTYKSIVKKLKGKLSEFSSEEKDLIKSLENIEEIISEGVEFVRRLNLSNSCGNNSTRSSNEQYRQTISTPGSMVIGRDKDRDHIVNLLRGNSSESTTNAKSYSIIGIWGMGWHIVKLLRECFSQSITNAKSYFVTRIWGMSGDLLRENFSESSSDGKCYSVIGIWGMGGLGKTTLAQYVCEHEKSTKYFDYVMWVYVSEKFNVRAIMEKMWESVSGSSCPSYENLDVLISQLAEKLRGKKYLLVLDDVWCEKGVSEQEMNQFFAPLRYGERGSKILVTTRNEEAARVLGAMDLMKLPEIADEDVLSLFMSHALRDVEENLEKGLRAIGEKIVGKLRCSPLAAITVASLLRRNRNHEFWSSMLNKNLLNDTMGSLFLSYQHLPPPLQRCFAFCSLFPKGHNFKHDHLVNLWIAEGLIETEDGNEHMKDIGNRYILELISSSFFQVGQNWDVKYYFMHDLIHDLAQDVSEGEYFRIESGEKKEIPAHTRHIYFERDMLREYVEKICKLKDLRTIIALGFFSRISLKEGDLDALFTKLRKLYVVEIEGISRDVKRVPKSLFQLRNLRYLNLRNCSSEYLKLDAHSELLCYQLRFLSAMSELFLIPLLTTSNENLIPNVGRLILLQDLRMFDVRMKRGFELKQLEHLNDLYGSLSIYGLNNVKSKEEAVQAKLSDKKGLRELHFVWDETDNDVEILDGLCPPPQIKKLAIFRYGGKRFPSWILENNDNVIHLQHLELFWCDGLEALPRINELSNLLSLTICSLDRLKSWVSLPLNLTDLVIVCCPNLVSLRGLNELTNLERLKVYDCDKLKCYSEADKLPQLKDLCIERFSLLEQLISKDGFSSLVSLELENPQQEYFSQEELEMFRSLSSLTNFSFQYREMRSLPNLMCLHSLINLKIVGCENLSCLPDVPPSVQRMEISGCDEEFTRSCKDPNHPNWRKISHIPDKEIR